MSTCNAGGEGGAGGGSGAAGSPPEGGVSGGSSAWTVVAGGGSGGVGSVGVGSGGGGSDRVSRPGSTKDPSSISCSGVEVAGSSRWRLAFRPASLRSFLSWAAWRLTCAASSRLAARSTRRCSEGRSPASFVALVKSVGSSIDWLWGRVVGVSPEESGGTVGELDSPAVAGGCGVSAAPGADSGGSVVESFNDTCCESYSAPASSASSPASSGSPCFGDFLASRRAWA